MLTSVEKRSVRVELATSCTVSVIFHLLFVLTCLATYYRIGPSDHHGGTSREYLELPLE